MQEATPKTTGGVTLVLNCLRSGGAEKQLLWISSEIVVSGSPCCILELTAGERTERIEAMVCAAIAKGVLVLRAPAGSGILRGLVRLRNYVAESQPALVWSWGLRSDIACFLGRFADPRWMWVISIRSANTRESTVVSYLRRKLSAFSDGAVSNTREGFVVSGVERLPNLPCWILPNALVRESVVRVVLPDILPKRIILVMVGNIKIRTKGYDLAAEVAQILQARGLIDFELRIAGRPDEFTELETVIRQCRVQDKIRFYGEVSHPENFLKDGHLFLLLSRFEGMPNTLLEALGVGLPAIATDVGDLRRLKAAGAPFALIPTGDARAAADAVENALARWPETLAAAHLGPSWVQQHFSEEACRTKLRSILAEVMRA